MLGFVDASMAEHMFPYAADAKPCKLQQVRKFFPCAGNQPVTRGAPLGGPWPKVRPYLSCCSRTHRWPMRSWFFSRWRADDVPAKLMAFADPIVQRCSWARAREYTETDTRSFFDYQEEGRARGEEVNFALVEPDDPLLVLGGSSVYDIDLRQGRAAVGFWVAAAARGAGCRDPCDTTHGQVGVRGARAARLELTCGPDNEASQRVAMRCGFVREGVLRSHMLVQGGVAATP